MVTHTTNNVHEIDMTFAQRLTTARKHAGLTQTALAERAGIHVTNIRRYEAGTNAPTLDALRNLTTALNTTADTLLFNPDERQPESPLAATLLAAINRLDPDSQAHLQATLEGLLLRAETRRWQQPTAS